MIVLLQVTGVWDEVSGFSKLSDPEVGRRLRTCMHGQHKTWFLTRRPAELRLLNYSSTIKNFFGTSGDLLE